MNGIHSDIFSFWRRDNKDILIQETKGFKRWYVLTPKGFSYSLDQQLIAVVSTVIVDDPIRYYFDGKHSPEFNEEQALRVIRNMKAFI